MNSKALGKQRVFALAMLVGLGYANPLLLSGFGLEVAFEDHYSID
jgi:hypothetical protein